MEEREEVKREEMTGADRPAEGLFELISFYCYESTSLASLG